MPQTVFLIVEKKNICHRNRVRITFFLGKKKRNRFGILLKVQPNLSLAKDVFDHWALSV